MENEDRNLWRRARKQSPLIFKALDDFLKDHPGFSTWLRDQSGDVRNRLLEERARRSDPARIREKLDRIRSEARDLQEHPTGRSTIDPVAWITQADAIERGVRFAEVQDRNDRKRTLARLKVDADGLLRVFIEETRDN